MRYNLETELNALHPHRRHEKNNQEVFFSEIYNQCRLILIVGG